MPVSLDQFKQHLLESGLMSAADIEAIWQALPTDKRPPNGEQLARQLVRQKKLTSYQARAVYEGKTQGLVLGNYVILDKLGEGGMGMVLKAQHRRMNRVVALKVLSPALVKKAESLKRFLREVQAAAKLTHPHIVAALDADEAKGIHFLVMEYVEGTDLSVVVKKDGPLPVERAVGCILQAARGLEYAHQQGIIHRDIKPANLLLDTKGTVKILDMGLARIEGADAQHTELTSTGAVMGTVDYMSPEQALNTKHADQRADIYSLGISLWYLLTGKPVYTGDSLMEKLLAHREQPIPSLSQARTDVPATLDAIFRRMVAKRPEDRFQSMTEVIVALQTGEIAAGSAPSFSAGPGDDSKFSEFLRNLEQEALGPSVATRGASRVELEVTPVAEKTSVSSAPANETDPDLAQSPGKTRRKVIATAPADVSLWNRKSVRYGAGGAAALFVVVGIWSLVGGSKTIENAGEKSSAFGDATTTRMLKVVENGDYALEFDGIDGSIEIPSLKYDGGEITLEARVRMGRMTSQGREIVALTSPRRHVSLWGYPPLAGISVIDPSADRVAHCLWESLDATQPINLAGVWDGKQTKLFVNGRLVATDTKVLPGTPTDGKQTAAAQSFIGGHSGRFGNSFDGVVDEVRISNTTRYKADYTVAARFDADEHTLALYHCDEGSGNVLKDSSGHNHHGTIVGTKWVRADSAVKSASPANDYALAFDGNGVVELDGGFRYKPDSCTIEAYVRVDAPVGRADIFSMSNKGSLGLSLHEGKHWRLSHVMDPAGHFGFESKEPIELGRRYHVAGVCDAEFYTLYVDGKRIMRSRPRRDATLTPGTRPSRIGFRFFGTIDDVRVSSKPRYSANFTPPTRHEADADTVLLYHCDEGTGNVLRDSSGHNYHGRIDRAKWIRADDRPAPSPPPSPPSSAEAKPALEFTGAGEHVLFPTLTGPAESITIEGWFRLDSSKDMSVITIPDADASGLIRLTVANGGPQAVRVIGKRNAVAYSRSGVLPVGKYFHLAVGYTGKTWAFWLDGKNIGEKADHYGWNPNVARLFPAIAGMDTRVPLSAGQRRAPFEGTFRELRISKSARYTTEFTPAERLEADRDTLALYHGDEATGDVLTDSSGNNHHGKIVGAKWVRIPGTESPTVAPSSRLPVNSRQPADASPVMASPTNMALDFGANGDIVRIEEFRVHNLTQPVTAECWVHPRAFEQVNMALTFGGRFYLQSSRRNATGQVHWKWLTNHTDDKRFYSISGPPIDPMPDSPVHLAGIFDGTQMRLYIDGRRQPDLLALTGVEENVPNENLQLGNPAPTAPLQLGAINSGSGSFRVLQGTLDEIRISRVARYTGDFVPAARFEPDADTLVLYHCDEGTGDVLRDSSGNHRHGKIVGAKWVRVTGSPNLPPSALAPSADPAESTLDGVWIGREVTSTNGSLPKDQTEGRKLIIRGNRYSLSAPGMEIQGTFQFDRSVNPHTLQFIPQTGGSPAVANQPQLGIYTRNGDTLTFCVGPPNGPRPTNLDSIPTGGGTRQTYRLDRSPAANAELLKLTLPTDKPSAAPPPPAQAPFDAAQARAHQEAWANHLGTTVETTNSVGAKLVLIPPGEFLMGSTDAQIAESLRIADVTQADPFARERIEQAERPQHRVVITRPFLIGATEVTVGQFAKFVEAQGYVTELERNGYVGSGKDPPDEKTLQQARGKSWRTPGYNVTDDLPVNHVNWNDAVAFCKWLSEQERTTYRLPTEAEWEYACRAGTTTLYSFGDAAGLLDQNGWYGKNAGKELHAVGLKPANPFGLHDMHGHLDELCQDVYQWNRYAATPQNDPVQTTGAGTHVVRGGSWLYSAPTYFRSASRSFYYLKSPASHNSYGFRVVRTVSP